MFSCLQQFLLCLVKDLFASNYEAKIERLRNLQGLKSLVKIGHIQIEFIINVLD